MCLIENMPHLPDETRRKFNALLFALMAVEGLVGLATLFNVRSEPGSAFLFGYSLARFLLAGVVISVVIVLSVFTLAALLQPSWWQNLSRQVKRIITASGKHFCLAALFSLFFAILAFSLLVLSTEENELVTQRSLLERAGFVIIWIELCILQLGLLVVLNYPNAKSEKPFFTPLRWSILLAITIIVYDIAFYAYGATSGNIWTRGHEIIYLPAIIGLLLGLHDQLFRDSRRYKLVNHLL
jgi:ABC-type Fe3+ transport system permease subunit